MSEDGSTPRPAPDVAPVTPATTTADVRIDYNSRIETRLWQLHKGSDRADARKCIKFARREFRVYVNGELLWSRNYGLDDVAQFDVDAEAKRQEMLGLGWEAV
jgi:hypothetical protein